MKTYNVTLTFKEPVLGTTPLDKEIYTTYIADKRVEELLKMKEEGKLSEQQYQTAANDVESEVDSITQDEKGRTGFMRLEDGRPFFFNYIPKGFLKDACSMLRRDKSTRSSKVTAFKKVIDGLVFIEPRRIPIEFEGEMTILERPLRAQTPQGERVALASSECIPAGAQMKFQIVVLDSESVPTSLLEEWLWYGQYRGLGQWRNASWGSFEYKLEGV